MKRQTQNVPHGNKRKVDRDLAELYGVTDRTIREWERVGAPLADPKQMVRWLQYNRSRGDEPLPLPAGLDHANILRHLADHAAAHFLPDALEHLAEPLTEMLVEEDGMDPFKARGVVILLHHMLLAALHRWTTESRFERWLRQSEGMDFDGMLRRLLPEYRDRSIPPGGAYRFPIGPKLRRLYEQNGGADVLASIDRPASAAE